MLLWHLPHHIRHLSMPQFIRSVHLQDRWECHRGNYKITEWLRWKEPLRIILFNPPAQAGSPRASCTGPCPDVFCLHIWRLLNLTGQPVAVLVHPHGEKVFPDVQKEPPLFQFVPPVLSLGTTEKSLAPSSSHPFFWHPSFVHFGKIPPVSRLNGPSSLSLCSYERCTSPFIIFMVLRWTLSSMSMSLLYYTGEPRTGPALQVWTH